MNSIKINKLEIENVKRVRAVHVVPSEKGLTVLGGKNNQGKTSVLDSIAWALGGKKYQPSNPRREGSVTPPSLRVELSNGLIVERKGKNSDLKVIDPSGNKAGQTLLDSFIEELALDLPKFMEATSKEKARTLLEIIGVGDKLFELDTLENKLYQERLAIGKIADTKKKHAQEMPRHEGVPEELISASDLIKQQQDILARNAEKERKRRNLAHLEDENKRLKEILQDYQTKLEANENDLAEARKSAIDLHDESTAELEANIAKIDEINAKIRINLEKDQAEQEAEYYGQQYKDLNEEIDAIRKERLDLLKGADLPLPGLSVVDGELTFNDQHWDNMSGSEQLRVATAIVRKLKPECGFVLIDKLEQMDVDTMKEFGKWLEQEDLQAIATRVSSGDECQIIIEDGYVVGQESLPKENDLKVEEKGWEF
ncbi:AAA family ATPase [Erysipelothrix rhusiopathiae]|uniref:AAA family ATPase n=1 Tax=Erysipelothrix rhusiopathiae TaxID=1648 RepID=UPI000210B4DD|nr:AAA family ATPase [Erysipelothrix rhusiopathiae]AMS11406.1 chromosome segregation protein SMC [Erysipelothrix rhusiopathiae]AOO67904.1 chromosome segregation protein SMC [Erysipelothrix rhusiopathiae]AWU41249.1 chromosome segregation protein SMC [Erysipelothrix rhusiopathiae]MDE8118458.1 AAA family ATPase [Erysipelothrix rhusiopathiae]MDE8202686.1 AAA family ATPase [Erysipelothrix rhusiopathiae]